MKLFRFSSFVYRLGLPTLFMLSSACYAEDYLPSQIGLSTFGADQGNTGSCSSEAFGAALDNAFLQHGSSMKVSSFYRHAFNWKDAPPSEADINLETDDEDKALLNKLGPLVPDYVYPEDAEGYNPYETGHRPHLSKIGVFPSSLPNANDYHFSKVYYTFQPGFGNSSNFETMRSSIKNNNGLVLTVVSDIFERFDWDHHSGLLREAYSWDIMVDRINKANAKLVARHAVAVIGYDDSIYKDAGYSKPGAFIIRNSWNTLGVNADANRSMGEESNTGFRAKLNANINMSGYYAIPYQYVLDLINSHLENIGYEVSQLDYVNYALATAPSQQEVQVLNLPFVCERSAYGISRKEFALYALRRYSDIDKKWMDEHTVKTIKDRALRERDRMENRQSKGIRSGGEPTFLFAKLSRTKSRDIDRAKEFYSGAFNNFYCPTTPGGEVNKVWPTQKEYETAAFQAALTTLSVDPYRPLGWRIFYKALIRAGSI